MREKLESHIIGKLERQFNYTISKSNFYMRKYKGLLNRNPFKAEEFFELPFTTKDELLSDQKINSPFGSNLCVHKNELVRIHKTSGTTNRPLIVGLTKKDVLKTIDVGSECFKASGLTENDIVIHCLNYNMWAGGYTDHQSLEKTGACVIPFGVGKTNNLIDTILILKPTAIHCTPSYLAKIELILKEDFAKSPIELNLKLGLFGGEGGLQNSNYRKSIEEKWGLKAMNANYGMSDVLSMFGAECRFQKGLHFMANDILFPEIIDIQTGESLKIENGIEGEQVITNLEKEAQPLIRYRTGDIIKILSTNKCECGQGGYLFEITGRTDDMIVVKGINVYINSIEKVLFDNLADFSGVYNILVNKVEPIDKVQIILEVNKYTERDNNIIIKSILKRIREDLFFNPEIKFVEAGSLQRTEGKSKKLFKIL